MSVVTHITTKRCCKYDGNPEEPQKKRKIGENEVCQNQQAPEKLDQKEKKKKPCLSPALLEQDCEITYDQLYGLLKYSALGKHHNVAQASWCRVHHQKRLAGVAVVVLPGVGQLHFDRFYLHFKHLRKTFRHRFRLPPVSEEFMEKLSGREAYFTQQISKQVMQNDPIIEKYGEGLHGLSRYILTPEEMDLNNYPQEGAGEGGHFVHTCCSGPVTDQSPLFGLDCEMCLTDKGSELTQISVVDASGRCVMNELVKPRLPIRNYLTRYSGITEKLLRCVKTTLSDIQDRLKKLLPSDAVLVGHSLNFDLQALEMVHPNVIDTSVLFARKRGKKFQLRFLAHAVLGKKIQCTENGHDPTEDARCALELAQYFIRHGPRKVAELNLEARLLRQNQMGKTPQNGRRKATPCLMDVLHSVGQKLLLLGGQAGDVPYGCQTDISSLNEQVLQRALEEVPLSSFSVIQFALESEQLTSKQAAEMTGKMRTKMAAMLTVYAGPFRKDFCLKSLRSIFKKYGRIQSIRVVKETFRPHICIQYEVLEAAQLAVERLNGTEVAGSQIKVRRPVTEVNLECETLVKELEKDGANSCKVYLTGYETTLSEAELQEELSCLENLSAIFVPKDPSTGRQRNYCFLQFRTPEGASRALQILEEKTAEGCQLQFRRALTPAHLYNWRCHGNQNGGKVATPLPHWEARFQENQLITTWEEDLKKDLKTFDRRIKKLFRHLPNHTLCVILLPGTKRISEALPGFGLLGIKEDPHLSSW